MNIVLWFLQVLLAAAFIAHGVIFIAPPAAVAEAMKEFPRWFALFLGTAEVLAGVGLVLPGMTRIMPWLVTWAAVGIMIVMIAATAFHLERREWNAAAITFCLLLMATFVSYKRRAESGVTAEGIGG